MLKLLLCLEEKITEVEYVNGKIAGEQVDADVVVLCYEEGMLNRFELFSRPDAAFRLLVNSLYQIYRDNFIFFCSCIRRFSQ